MIKTVNTVHRQVFFHQFICYTWPHVTHNMVKKAEGEKKSAAAQTGKALAHVQDAVDVAGKWAFGKLKSLESTKVDSKTTVGKAKRTLVKLGHFLGEAGHAFYEEYEQLKKEQKKAGKKLWKQGEKIVESGQKAATSVTSVANTASQQVAFAATSTAKSIQSQANAVKKQLKNRVESKSSAKAKK